MFCVDDKIQVSDTAGLVLFGGINVLESRALTLRVCAEYVDVPVITDVHEPCKAPVAAEVVRAGLVVELADIFPMTHPSDTPNYGAAARHHSN